jgi:hypothetical protein
MSIALNEPTAVARTIPLLLVNGALTGVSGLTFSGAQIRTCKAGGALTNFVGTYSETGSGNYNYILALGEVNTNGFLAVVVNHSSAMPYVWFDQVGAEPIVNEPSAANRRIPIYIVDSNQTPLTGLTFSGSEVQISKAGSAWANAVGAITELGAGLYYYQGSLADFDIQGVLKLKVVKSSIQQYVFELGVGTVSTGGPSDAVAPIVTVTSTPVGRLDPLVVEVYDETSLAFFEAIFREYADSPVQVAYDSQTGFIHPFGGRSTISGSGTSGDPYILTIYRRGGWPTGISFNLTIRAYDEGGNLDSE